MRVGAGLAGGVLLALLAAPAASAVWSASASGKGQLGADTMANATGLTTACSGTSSIALTWTRSPDSYVAGYRILRSGSNGSSVTLNAAATASSYTDTPTTVKSVTYTYSIRAVAQSWTTAALAASSTRSFSSTGRCS